MQYDAHQTHNNEFTMSIYIFFYSYLIYPIHQTTEKEEREEKNDMIEKKMIWEKHYERIEKKMGREKHGERSGSFNAF